MSDVDAVVLVGGQGTRLRPLTLSAPKPMLPTAGVPFLTHLLSRIKAAGVDHVVLGTSYRAEVFEQHFGTGASLGLDLEYVVETEPLGTGGGIRNVLPALRAETVMVFNGDVLSGVDLTALLATHHSQDADATLYLTRVPDPTRFGCVSTDASGRVTAFLEKTPDPPTDQINAGTYVFRREVVEAIPTGRPVSVERETFPGLLAEGRKVCGFVDSTYWRDLGTPGDFVAGSADLVRGIAPTEALPGPTGAELVLQDATVDASARLTGGTTVGARSQVAAGARLASTVLFDDVVVGEGAVITRSVIGRGSRVGAGTVLIDAVIGDDVHIGARNELLHGARVWPGTRLPDGSVRFSADVG